MCYRNPTVICGNSFKLRIGFGFINFKFQYCKTRERLIAALMKKEFNVRVGQTNTEREDNELHMDVI